MPVALGEKASRRFSGNIFVAGGKHSEGGLAERTFAVAGVVPAILCNDGRFITRVCLSERSARVFHLAETRLKVSFFSMAGARWKKPTLNF